GDTKILFAGSDAAPRENAALTAIRLRPAVPRAGDPVTAACEVLNAGGMARTVPVTLTLSNGTRSVETVQLAPYSSATANFRLLFDTPQRLEAVATLPADNLALDDTRRAVIDLQQTAVVVLITDENATTPPAAAYFL